MYRMRIVGLKGLLCAGFISFFSALIIILQRPSAQGYEISIYSAYPWYFWILICFSSFTGIVTLIYNSFVPLKSKSWVIGLIICMFCNITLLLLPIFRAYTVSNFADEVTHLGIIKDILLNGHTGSRNFYPSSHLIVISIYLISSIPPELCIKFIPAIFYSLYIVCIYKYAEVANCLPSQKMLILAFGSVLLFTYFNYLFLPTQLFLYYVPFILLVNEKRNSIKNKELWSLIFILVLIFLPFFHPLGTFFVISIIIIYEAAKVLSQFPTYKSMNSIKYVNLKPAIILTVIMIIWFSTFVAFKYTILEAYNAIIYDYGASPVVTVGQQLQSVNYGYYDLFELISKNYGHELIYTVLSVISIYILIRNILLSKYIPKQIELFAAMSFLFFSVFYGLTLIGSFLSTGSSIRIFCWSLMFSILLNGMILHNKIYKLTGNRFKIGVVFVSILIIVSSIIGIFSLYPSPYTKQANFQVTTMDWTGMNKYYIFKNSDPTFYINQLPWRTSHAIYGYDTQKEKNLGSFYPISPHFGYNPNNTNTLAESINSSGYFVINEHNIQFYTNLWVEHSFLRQNDFERFYEDITSEKIYTNGELQIWRVYKQIRS